MLDFIIAVFTRDQSGFLWFKTGLLYLPDCALVLYGD